MPRIHFVVSETAKIAYRTEASREGKSLGEWMREAADEKLAAARPRKFTVKELARFNAECDQRRSEEPEPEWDESKRVIAESRLAGLE